MASLCSFSPPPVALSGRRKRRWQSRSRALAWSPRRSSCCPRWAGTACSRRSPPSTTRPGTTVTPSEQTVTAAAAQKPAITPTDFSIVNQPGTSSYPISGYSWALVYTHQPDQARGQALVPCSTGSPTTARPTPPPTATCPCHPRFSNSPTPCSSRSPAPPHTAPELTTVGTPSGPGALPGPAATRSRRSRLLSSRPCSASIAPPPRVSTAAGRTRSWHAARWSGILTDIHLSAIQEGDPGQHHHQGSRIIRKRKVTMLGGSAWPLGGYCQ